jgi:NADH dehydrogenase [ubiquinone] 1 alpha subcomplex assembly factor 5
VLCRLIVSSDLPPRCAVLCGGVLCCAVDSDVLTCRYPDLFTLCSHLSAMGEANAALARAPFVSKDVFMSAAAAYHELYADADGLLPATFHVIYLIGWAPHSSQAKPLERGTASHHLSQLPTAGSAADSGTPRR